MADAPDERIGSLLERHYRTHGLAANGGETSSWFRLRIGSVSLLLPNPPGRRRALFFHDVNHVAAGYNTMFSEGEMEIAGFEIGAGCGRYFMAWLINLFMLTLGIVSRPRRTFRALVRGRRTRSIYTLRLSKAQIVAMTLSQLRSELRIDDPTSGSSAEHRE